MVVDIAKLAYSEMALRILKAGRKPAAAAIHLSPEAKASAQAAARKSRLLSKVTPTGRPKYMEVPRAAYGGPGTKQELEGGKAIAKQMEMARAVREAEELGSLGKSLSQGKTIGGFAPGTLNPYQASQAIKGLEQQPLLGGATVFQNMPAKIGSFREGFLDELRKIAGCP